MIAYSTKLVCADIQWYMQSKLRFNFKLITVTIKNVVFWLKLDVKNTDELIVTAVINFLSRNLQGVAKNMKSQTCGNFFFFFFFFDEWNQFYIAKSLKTVLICKMHKNDVIALKLCSTIELIKCNVCMEYEPSTKCTTPGIKKNKFMTSSLHGPFELD